MSITSLTASLVCKKICQITSEMSVLLSKEGASPKGGGERDGEREGERDDDDDIYSSRLPLGRTLAPLEQLILHPSLKPISSSFPTTTSWLTTSTTRPSSQYEHGIHSPDAKRIVDGIVLFDSSTRPARSAAEQNNHHAE